MKHKDQILEPGIQGPYKLMSFSFPTFFPIPPMTNPLMPSTYSGPTENPAFRIISSQSSCDCITVPILQMGFSSFLPVTSLVSERAGIQTQVCLTPEPVFLTSFPATWISVLSVVLTRAMFLVVMFTPTQKPCPT